MKINRDAVLEIVRGVSVFFEDREESAHIRAKGREDFVTEADTSVQQYIYDRLNAAYPDVQFMSEEKNNAEIDTKGDLWILDPVDGTKNLIRDYRASALSLGYVEEGELVFGVVYQPYLDEMFYAEKGAGAFVNGRPIRVSSVTDMGNALIGAGLTPFDRSYEERNLGLMNDIFRRASDIRRSGSAAMELAWVAAGRSDVFYEAVLKPWDVAAGTMLVREAGGRVRAFDGSELDVTSPAGIVAGNGVIDEEVMGLIRKYRW